MSTKYSIGGYKIALQARTSKTLLVEGKDDKELFNCLKTNRNIGDNVVIDTHEILSDSTLEGLGAKARIDVLISHILPGSALIDKLWCFVDREWEELIDVNTLDAIPWTGPVITNVRVKTTGHSIENYGFHYDFVVRYLRHFGQGLASPAFCNQISNILPEVMNAAAAFSEVARKKQLIVKCNNIIEISDIGWSGNKITLSQNFEQRLIGRGAQNANGFMSEFNQIYNGKWSQSPLTEESHLHAHGHIGEMLLWTVIGQLLVSNGAPLALGREVASGRKDERRRVWHSWMSGLTSTELYPLEQPLT